MAVALAVAVLALGISIFGFFFLRRYIRLKTTATSLLSEYREEVARLIAEIDAATDRDTLLVEERIKILRKMLEDTDRRIGLYVREVQRSRSGEAMYASLGRGIRMALDSRVGESTSNAGTFVAALPDLDADGVAEDADVGAAAGEVTASADVGAETDPPADTGAVEKVSLSNARFRLKVRIAELSAAGSRPNEIAAELGISVAEVEFALNLLNRGDAPQFG